MNACACAVSFYHAEKTISLQSIKLKYYRVCLCFLQNKADHGLALDEGFSVSAAHLYPKIYRVPHRGCEVRFATPVTGCMFQLSDWVFSSTAFVLIGQIS